MTPGFVTNPVDLVILLLVAFLVLGPKRLPEVARSVGRGLREARSAFSGSSHHGQRDQAAARLYGSAPPIERAFSQPAASPRSAGQGVRELDSIE